jgi:tetratricopeptide (TPR) repeat protein
MALGLVLGRVGDRETPRPASFGAVAERLRRAGQFDQAVTVCREGLAEFPHHLSARVTLGWALIELGRHDEARTELEAVLKRAPDNLAAIRALADLHDRTAGDVRPSESWQTSESIEAERPDETPDARPAPATLQHLDLEDVIAAVESEDEDIEARHIELTHDLEPQPDIEPHDDVERPHDVEWPQDFTPSEDVQTRRDLRARHIAAFERLLMQIETRRANQAVA